MAKRKNITSRISKKRRSSGRGSRRSSRRNVKSLKKGGGIWNSIFGNNSSEPASIDTYAPLESNPTQETAQETTQETAQEKNSVPLVYNATPTTTGGRRRRTRSRH